MKTLFFIIGLLALNVLVAQRVAYRYYLTRDNISDLLYGDPDPRNVGTAVTPQFCPDDRRLKTNVSYDKGVAYVDIWGFENPAPANCTTATAIHQGQTIDATHRYFFDFRRMNLSEYPAPVKMQFKGFNYGLLTMPLKIRPGLDLDSSLNKGIMNVPTTANASFNVGLFFGGSIGRSKLTYKGINTFAFTLAGFVGPTIAELKEGTVNSWDTDFRKEINGNKTIVLPAVTYGFAAIGSFNAFGVVLGVGWDSPIGKGRSYWYYKEKLWVGLGVVASLPF